MTPIQPFIEVIKWVFVLTIYFPTTPGSLPKKAEIQIVYNSQKECGDNKRLIMDGLTSPYGIMVSPPGEKECMQVPFMEAPKP